MEVGGVSFKKVASAIDLLATEVRPGVPVSI